MQWWVTLGSWRRTAERKLKRDANLISKQLLRSISNGAIVWHRESKGKSKDHWHQQPPRQCYFERNKETWSSLIDRKVYFYNDSWLTKYLI